MLTTSGLGSCIGIAIYDTRNTVAGLVHVMLPSAADIDGGNHAKFADTGIQALIEAMADAGASTEAMEAKIAGGSCIIGHVRRRRILFNDSADGDCRVVDRPVLAGVTGSRRPRPVRAKPSSRTRPAHRRKREHGLDNTVMSASSNRV